MRRRSPPSAAAIETPFFSSWKGADKPDVTLTYFFDYACGYCRRAIRTSSGCSSEDKGLRVVYRELPILGPDSVAAARVSLAAPRPASSPPIPRHDVRQGGPTPGPRHIALAAEQAPALHRRRRPAADEEAELARELQPSPARSARPARRCSWSATG